MKIEYPEGAKVSRWWQILCALLLVNLVGAFAVPSVIEHGWLSSPTPTAERTYETRWRGDVHRYVHPVIGVYFDGSIPLVAVLILLMAAESRRAHKNLASRMAQELREN